MDWQTSLNILGIILTIFFGFLSYVFYKKSTTRKNLRIFSSSAVLIPENLKKYENIKILYNNEEIETLVTSQITISNTGNTTIEDHDIVPSDPIIISTSKKFLYEDINECILVSDKKVTASLQKIDDLSIKLIFDFLKPKEKICITLLHNGAIKISGDLKTGNINYIQDNEKYL